MTENPHYVTPEEASAKTCHIISTALHGVICLGPKCMAWRWVKITDYNHLNPTEKFSTTHGYCGMVIHG